MFLVGNEGCVLGMVRREELRSLREEPETVDVPERPAKHQRCEQSKHGGADETGSHGSKVYAFRPTAPYFTPAIDR